MISCTNAKLVRYAERTGQHEAYLREQVHKAVRKCREVKEGKGKSIIHEYRSLERKADAWLKKEQQQ